jgi:hypothetical protein
MKSRMIVGALALICCGATAYISYAIGYRKCYDVSQVLRYSDTIVSLDALSDLRSGHLEEGTRKVEAICFSHAAMIYCEPKFQQRFAGRTNAAWSAEVRQYLATYYTNRTEWTPMIVRLEKGLQSWP